jgi:hypothetical protein
MPFSGFQSFVWPLPIWLGRKPGVSSQWFTARDGGKRKHLGADIMYPRMEGEPAKPPGGSTNWAMPVGVPVIACGSGTVWSKQDLDNGYAVRLDHGNPYTSLYLHLNTVAVKKGDRVEAGTVLGTVGPGPRKLPNALRHLHFEIEVWGERGKKVNVNPEIGSWSIYGWKFYGWDKDGKPFVEDPSSKEELAKEAAEKRSKAEGLPVASDSKTGASADNALLWMLLLGGAALAFAMK